MCPTRFAPPSRRSAASGRPGRARPTGADLAGLARLSALATVLGLVLLALLGVGRRLPTPPLSFTSAEGWSSWLTRVGPAGATMSVVRVMALALAAYLLLLVAIEVVGRAVGLPRLLSLGHVVSTPLARQLIGGVAGVGVALSLAAATVGPAGPASAGTLSARSSTETTAPPSATGPTAADSPVMRALDPTDAPTSADRTTMTSLESQPPVMHAVDASPDPAPSTTDTLEPAPTSTSVAPAGPTDPTAPTDAAPSPAPPTATDQWVIRGGDHLWGVARRTLAGSWHRAPTDAETARYLDHLIEANLEVLVVPGDADLVLPGQVFQLPPVPAG